MIWILAVYWIIAGFAVYGDVHERNPEKASLLVALTLGGLLIPARILMRLIK